MSQFIYKNRVLFVTILDKSLYLKKKSARHIYKHIIVGSTFFFLLKRYTYKPTYITIISKYAELDIDPTKKKLSTFSPFV